MDGENTQTFGTLPAECLVAVVGIAPTRAPTAIQYRLAEKFPQRLAGRVARYLDSETPGEFQWVPPPPQSELHEKLFHGPESDVVAEWFQDRDPVIGASFLMVANSAREKVKESWAVFPDPSLGIHNYELAPDEYMDVWQAFRTLDSVETIFDDLDAGVLLPEQVSAFASVYPALYQTVKDATFSLLIPYMEIEGALQKTKDLSPQKEEQIRIMLQLQTDAPIAAQDESQQRQDQQAKTKGSEESKEEGASLRTPSEHTNEKRIAS